MLPKPGKKRRRMTQKENAALTMPKPRREVVLDYGDFIRSWTCSIAGKSFYPRGARYPEPHVCVGIIEADHLDTRGAGGSDLFQVPLCTYAHAERQSSVLREFEEKYGVNLWEIAARLIKHYYQPSFRDTLPVRRTL